VTVHGVTVEAVPAYNIGKLYHPKANNWIGFLITVEASGSITAGIAMSFRK